MAALTWVLAAGLCCAAGATHLLAADAVPAGAGAPMVAGPQAARTVDPDTGQEVIVIPPDWQRQEPFAGRFVRRQDLPPAAHVIDIAATRFVTNGLPKWAPGEHKLTASAMSLFPAELVRQPFALADRDYFIVQANNPTDQAKLRTFLEAQKIPILGYIPHDAYILRVDESQVALVSARPEVFWLGPVQPAYCLDPTVDYVIETDPAHESQLTALFDPAFFAEADAVVQAVSASGLKVVLTARGVDDWIVRLQGQAILARLVATIPGCRWVERYVEPKLANNIARTSQSVPTGRGSSDGPIMDVENVWKKGIHGEGQIAAIADTGLSTGDLATLHKDFGDQSDPANPPRVKAYFSPQQTCYSWCPSGTCSWLADCPANYNGCGGLRNAWSDDVTIGGGHGTHVAGSLLGDGDNSGASPGSNDYRSSYAGIAPKATLVFQSLLDITGYLVVPPDLNPLFQESYDAGAKVLSNSWGDEARKGQYPEEAKNVDRFTWVHKDALVIFSAGNEGEDGYWRNCPASCASCSCQTAGTPDGVIDASSITPPATAKNVIAVGASENYRPNLDYGATCGNTSTLTTWGQFGLGGCPVSMSPLVNDQLASDASGLAPFSSRGPTADGRFKPDLVAPGVGIISTKTFVPDGYTKPIGWGSWGLTSAECTYYNLNSGTSMAAPLVAGSAVLVRQYFADGWHANHSSVTSNQAIGTDGFFPSAALVKAVLINGAWDMAPGQYGTGATQEIPPAWDTPHNLPNNAEGYGRVDLFHSLFAGQAWGDDPNRRMVVHDVTPGLREADPDDGYSFAVASATNPLVVTLVWTDPDPDPIVAGGAPAIVNQLNLIVTSPNGTQYVANSADTPGTTADNLNNVQQVKVTHPVSGTWTIAVHAANIPGNGLADSTTQPYALVISGVTQTELSAQLAATPSSGFAPLGVTLTATASGSAAGTLNYSFWWDCGNSTSSVQDAETACGVLPSPAVGTCESNTAGYKCNALPDGTTTQSPAPYTYSSPGTFTAKVIIERGTAQPAQAQATITALGPLPGYPQPLSPGLPTDPGPELTTLTPVFTWAGVAGADTYGLYISQYPYGAANLVYQNESIPVSDSSLTLPAGVLVAGTKYRWNMGAHNASGWTGFSSPLYFSTSACSYSVSPTSLTFDAGASVQSVPVITGSGCSWAWASNANWITAGNYGGSASGSGGGTTSLAVDVAANTGTVSRTGTITIAGQVVTVTQGGTGCTYALVPASATFTADGGAGSVGVSTQAGCAWSLASWMPWVTVTGGANGSGPGTLSYAVAANTSTSSRSDYPFRIQFGSSPYWTRHMVVQGGTGCTYSVSPTSLTFDAGASVQSVPVITGSGCSWAWASNANWINSQEWNSRVSGTMSTLSAVVSMGSLLVAVGDGGTLLTSADGFAWATGSSGTTQPLQGVAWSGSQLTAVGVSGTILTSPDGNTWTARPSGASHWLYGVTWAGTQFVAVGDTGTILTGSADGATWTGQTSGTTQTLYGVTASATQIVAVGAGGTILSSPDGSVWTAQISGTTAFLRGVTWTGAQFVAVGSSGTIVTSPDGTTWTQQTSPTSQYLYGIAWTGTRLFVVGDAGTILRSADGVTWSARSSATGQALYAVAWNGSQPVAVGAAGTIVTGPNAGGWGSGSGSGSASVSVPENPDAASRTGTITIAGQVVTVTQGGTGCAYALTPGAASFTAAGGAGTVNVSTGGACAWSLASWLPWVTVTANASGSGPGTLSYAVAANTSTSSRSGYPFQVRNSGSVAQHYVAQGGTACTYSASPGSLVFDASSSSKSVAVTAGSGCSWAYASNASWISDYYGDASGSGSGTSSVNVKVAANAGSSLRTGTITIAGQVVTVTQLGVGCYLLTTAASPLAGGSVQVNTPQNCSGGFQAGTAISLSAVPLPGYVFSSWSGSGGSFSSTSLTTTTFTLTGSGSVIAYFASRPAQTLTVIPAGTGSGAVTSSPAGISCGTTCSYTFAYNTVVTLTATPDRGWVFTGWSGEGCSGTGTCQVTMTQARNVTAAFNLGVTGALFHALTPCRVLDTRVATGPTSGAPLGAGQRYVFTATGGACGVPSGAVAIVSNLTVVGSTAAGELRVMAGSLTSTNTSAISFGPSRARANNAIVQLATDGSGTISVINNSAGTVHFILDVNGYFQ